MKIARKYLDFAADFVIFVAACFFIVSGVSRISIMQETLHNSLSDKGLNIVLEAELNEVTGVELIAQLCYPEGFEVVLIDGVRYEGDLREVASCILVSGHYTVERNDDVDGSITLLINSIMEVVE